MVGRDDKGALGALTQQFSQEDRAVPRRADTDAVNWSVADSWLPRFSKVAPVHMESGAAARRRGPASRRALHRWQHVAQLL